MKARERKLTLILSVCLVVLFVAMYILVVVPKLSDMNTKASDAEKAKNQAEAALSAAEKLDPKDIDKRLGNLKARIPSSIEISNLTYRISEKAVANNLIWLQGDAKTITTDTATAAPATGQTNTLAPNLTTNDLTIVVRGQMPDFIRFMSDLTDKSIGRVIVINSADVQFKTDEGPDSIEATLKLEVIGWQDGGDINSDGCAKVGATGTPEDPNCNRTTVSTPASKSKEGNS